MEYSLTCICTAGHNSGRVLILILMEYSLTLEKEWNEIQKKMS